MKEIISRMTKTDWVIATYCYKLYDLRTDPKWVEYFDKHCGVRQAAFFRSVKNLYEAGLLEKIAVGYYRYTPKLINLFDYPLESTSKLTNIYKKV